MKFRKIFNFELGYQARRISTWLYFAVLVILPFLMTRGNYVPDALLDDFYVNSPFVIGAVTAFGSLIWLMAAASISGEIAARDVQTGMHPLTYTTPVRKAHYLGARFLAAFILNALILLGVQMGIMLSVYLPGVEAEIIGPFRPVAYLTAYSFVALPNAFIATAIQFSFAALNGRPIASYLGSMILFLISYIGSPFTAIILGRPDIAKLTDFVGVINIVSIPATEWTPAQKGAKLFVLEGPLLWNRMLWIAVALATLALTHRRFSFAHYSASSGWRRLRRRRKAQAPTPADMRIEKTSISIPRAQPTFGILNNVHQSLAIAKKSFGAITRSRGGLPIWIFIALLTMLAVSLNLDLDGVPIIPRTDHIIKLLTAPLTNVLTPWVIFPLLIVVYTGEIVWREREAGISEIIDAASVPEWVVLLGKFLSLAFIIMVWMALLVLVGVLVQAIMGYHDFEPGLYLKVFFGLQLTEYLLFAMLALMLHTLINQKFISHLVTLVIYAFIGLASRIGVEHNLLIYSASPGWSYTQMRGFGTSLMPWIWFKLYWIIWALFLAVVARLFWVRGKEGNFRVRFQLARRRFTGTTAGIATAAIALILPLGSFIFYNTNELNNYSTASQRKARQAEYERKYVRYKNVQQAQLTAVKLNVEIYPGQRKAAIRGSYSLVNANSVAIDSIHLENAAGVKTGEITFNRPATHALADDELRHHIYVLKEPLQPGDSLQLNFEVHFEPRGFGNKGADPSVVANGTYFITEDWLPAIGYQSSRELMSPGDRRRHGLTARSLIPSLSDDDAHSTKPTGGRISFEATIGTQADQVAVAPGVLQQTWKQSERRYFRYVTDAPVGTECALFSAKYSLCEASWKDSSSGQLVAINIFYHPGHNANLDRIVKSAQASLDYYTKQYGAYPYSQVSFVEHPGHGQGMHAEPSMITMEEAFSLFNPDDDRRGFDLPFAVVAHEMAHQWWGGRIKYAPAEGAVLLTESPAWFSAMGVIKETYGPEKLRRFLSFMREPYPILPVRPSVPLLRAIDPYGGYRKGPFALHAISEYMGREKVNLAYKHLVDKYGSPGGPRITSLELYDELKAVTPDSLQSLLHDLFAANTFWELKMERVVAEKTASGMWQVTLEVNARKTVVSEAGEETELPMDNWVEIGVFAPVENGESLSKPLHVQKHRIRSGKQTIKIMAPQKPARAAIDPYHLLFDWKPEDNFKRVY
jgi:ABC-2 type transport system permease protein